MRIVKSLFQIFIISLLLFNGFTSCALFENDVAEFMEKYTETAAIEEYNLNVETYNDELSQLCISSYDDAEVTFLMRNPKRYSLIPSVIFNNLNNQYNRSAVQIEQTEIAVVHLLLPQKFLIPVDEGKDITADVDLYEPMSGRNFERYTLKLSCNTKPPTILNPTIINNHNNTFVVAFDMPNEEEVAIRHKDLACIEINGKSYPVSVTVITDPNADPETPDVKIAQYTINDSHFTRTWNNNYRILNSKDFVQNQNSFYYETDDPFFAGDKEYKIILKDKAGLSSEVKASTKISKLEKPVILDQSGNEISEDGLVGIPYDEEAKKGTITIIPPTEDHLGHSVSGTTVYYKVYEATGSGLIYTSGTTTTTKTIELPQNTYRVEAYAVLTNYENSSTRTVKFRFMNNILFVRACTDPEGFQGDGSERAPYSSIQEALDDINNLEERPDKADKFKIYVEGDFTTGTYYIDNSDPDNPTVAYGVCGEINLSGTMNTDQLEIAKNPRASAANGAKLKSITVASDVDLSKVTIGNVTVTNSAGNAVTQNNSNTLLIIDGADISNSSGYAGVYAAADTVSDPAAGPVTVTIKSGTISHNSNGIYADNCILNLEGGSIVSNSSTGLVIDDTVTLNVQGKPIVKDNNTATPDKPKNIVLPEDYLINITSRLETGASIGITTATANEPATFEADPYSFTTDYGTYNTAAPSDFFTSDRGFAIVPTGGEASLKMSGASGNEHIASEYTFEFAETNYSVKLGNAKTLNLTPLVKRSGTQLAYASKIDGNNVTWAAALYSGSTYLCDLTVSNVSGGISLTIPAQDYMGTYKAQLQVTFMGMQHDLELTLTVINPVGEKLAPDAVKDIVFSDGSAIAYTDSLELSNDQKQKAVAFIFSVSDGKVLGVGFKQTQKAWAKSGVPGASARIPDNDGNGFDVEDVKTYAATQGGEYNEENYPAFWWAEHYGVAVRGDSSGWYLPNSSELSASLSWMYAINAVIDEIGESSDFVKFPTGVSASFSSATQHWNWEDYIETKGYNASGSAQTGNNNKTYELYVRAVREF
ncbi:hypothetical protein SAMN04487775_103111 [Treponema bryantii]|uniref:Uncharacterized protein n=1 Tax=Treponema bryantii TaxID=163 RepID=A0A1I3JLL1_9SPIR|nr:hypothetical protein [Treponema bryantii]SFI61147.1 hypothetical protein SAMN04487775_103111 [Treponema bryantii]